MKGSTSVAVILGLALVASNAWWAYRAIDAGVSYAYQSQSLEESQQGLAQAVAIINAIASQGSSRTVVMAASQKALPSSEPFEKEGYTWVGRLGLRFNDGGVLVHAVAGL